MDDNKTLVGGDAPASLLPEEPAVPAAPPADTSAADVSTLASPAPQAAQAPLDWGIAPQDTPQPQVEEPTAPAPVPEISDVPPSAQEETLVIPPAGANTNPFIPQGVEPSGQNPPGTAPPRPAGSSFLKRLVIIMLFLLLIAGVALGIKYVLGMATGSSTAGGSITYWGLWEDNATLQTAIADFQTVNPGIKVTYVKQSSRQYRERLQAAITRGDGPDVFQFHNTWVPMLQSDLSPAPATVMSTSEFASTFYPVASQDLVGGQSIYGVPLLFDGLGLYYNEDLLTAAGVQPPTTWPELLDVVPKLTVITDKQIQQSAIALGTTANVENFSDIIGLMMIQNGASPAKPTGKEAEDTLTFYRKFANPSDPVYTWNEGMDNSVSAFAASRVAMMIAPSWRVFDVKQMNPDLNFKIAPVPQLPGNTVNWASYWAGGVSTKSKSQAAAWAFLKYMTSHDTQTKMYTEESKTRLFGEIYPRVDLGGTVTDDPYVGAYVEEAPTAKSFPLASRTFDNGINDKLIQYLTDAVNAVGSGTAPSAALQTASAGFSQVLTSYGLSTGAAPATTQ